MAPAESEVILDIGSGTGNLALAIARHCPGVRYLGIDPDETATRIARSKTAQLVPPPEFLVGFFSASAVAHWPRSEETTLELQSLLRTQFAAFCLKKKKTTQKNKYK